MGTETETTEKPKNQIRSARKNKGLTALFVKKTTKRGYYADGRGLYLQVSATGSKSWVFRFRFNGRSREMGLGSIHDVEMAQAREQVKLYRQQIKEGIDPIEARQQARQQREYERQEQERQSEYLFPGQRVGKPISNMAMLTLLKRMGYGGQITAHGFRSTFRDWMADWHRYIETPHHEGVIVPFEQNHITAEQQG
ncbi:DUF4102 domain-containing protein [Ectothiorhodospiraceae bacterium BW-2]|nr:DUF4102 domain-containing protein [Ectothiorhodospiraceae bacterium BW-2]